jgi:hypothetical protein
MIPSTEWTAIKEKHKYVIMAVGPIEVWVVVDDVVENGLHMISRDVIC